MASLSLLPSFYRANWKDGAVTARANFKRKLDSINAKKTIERNAYSIRRENAVFLDLLGSCFEEHLENIHIRSIQWILIPH